MKMIKKSKIIYTLAFISIVLFLIVIWIPQSKISEGMTPCTVNEWVDKKPCSGSGNCGGTKTQTGKISNPDNNLPTTCPPTTRTVNCPSGDVKKYPDWDPKNRSKKFTPLCQKTRYYLTRTDKCGNNIQIGNDRTPNSYIDESNKNETSLCKNTPK